MILPNGNRICCTCKTEKPLPAFYPAAQQNDDARRNCRQCGRAHNNATFRNRIHRLVEKDN